MRILVTGDAGFIGHHVTHRLLQTGHAVLGVDAVTSYYSPQLKKDRRSRLAEYDLYSVVTGRLEDATLIEGLVREFQPAIVIHLAAQAGVRYSLENPDAYISANIIGTQVLLNALRASPPKHTLIASTSSAYGGNRKLPFSETDATQSPVSLYAATKIAVESLAHAHSHLWELPITSFRFFTVYGPWGRPDMALFKFVTAIREGRPIDIYGHGKMSRDFTFIDDLVDGVVGLTHCPPKIGEPAGENDTLSAVAPYRVVNVGGGHPTPLLRFVEAVESAVGEKAKRRYLDMQPGDVVSTFADTTLLRELIGTAPETPVDVGVRAFVEWFDDYSSKLHERGLSLEV